MQKGICMHFDPWLTTPVGRGSASGKKVARLAGKDSGRAHVLIELHDWSRRAIYIYNLTMPDTTPDESRMRHIPRPSDEVWGRYGQLGVEIPHPGKIQATDVTRWVNYGSQEARRLGLKIE
jgi:hypothetical protein